MPSSQRKPRVLRARKPVTSAAASRGEHSLTLASVPYRLRPSYIAVNTIEEATGRSLIELLRAADTCALSYADLGTIVAEMIRAGAETDMNRAVSADRIAELIYEEGAAKVFPVVVLLLADAISGGRTSSGEAKAMTGSTTA